MRSLRVITTLLLAIALLVTPASIDARPSVLAAVKPITLNGRNGCTATSINQQLHLWLTAAHCVIDFETGESHGELAIMGDVFSVVELDVDHDIAIVKTPNVSAPALKLAKEGPRVCLGVDDKMCKVQMTGHPFGMPYALTVQGTVAYLGFKFPDYDQLFTVFNMVAAPGNSGSAVLNYRLEIVAVLQIVVIPNGRGWTTMSGGSEFEDLARYRRYFE